MSHRTTDLAILIAHISDSAALHEELGNLQARDAIAKCIAIMQGVVAAHQGALVKTAGGEIMCTFSSAGAALTAACSMQRAVELGQPGGNRPVFIHIGVNYGEAICEPGNVHGHAVNIAARVARIAHPREIITTQAAIDLLPAELRGKVRQISRSGIKDKHERISTFQVIWEQEETLHGHPALTTAAGNEHAELRLHYYGYTYHISAKRRTLLLGRDAGCDVISHNRQTSRQHARVEFRSGKFVLIDHSVNGTYLRFNDGQTFGLSREEIILHSAGSISLGQPFKLNPTELVEFTVSY